MPSRPLRNILIGLILLAVTLPAFFCNSPKSGVPAEHEEAAWRNVYDTNVHYVGMQTCRTCHEGVYQTFIQTGMGQSFDHATRQKSAADFDPAHSLVYDKDLDFYYKPYFDKDSLF